MRQKNNLFKMVLLILVLLLLFSGCSVQTSTTAPSTAATTLATTTQAETTGTTAAANLDVWAEKGWPEHPLGVEIPDWEELPALSDDYRFRQTDASVEREMEGNMYKKGWPLVKETETLSILCQQASDVVNIAEGHYLVEKLEERNNVKLDFELIPAANWAEGKNLAIASGDLPDIIIGGAFTKTEQLLYGQQQGLLVDLTPYITDEYTYYIAKSFEKRKDVLDYITTPAKAVYGLPSMAQNYHVSLVNKMWVNTAWLKAVDLEKPTTTDEFADMLRAFKTKDPNGNGKQDEMPLVGSPTSWATQIDNFLVNAFTFHPYSFNYFVADNGVATMSVIKDEYKEALKWINGLYEEGLIDKDSFTRDGTALASLGLSNPDYDIIGAFPGGYYGIAGYDIDHTTARSSVWEPISPLKGPNGVQTTYQDPFGAFTEAQFVVTSAAKNPALCVRFIDYFYMPWSDIGEQDVTWRFAKEGEMDLWYKNQAYFTSLDTQFDGRGGNTRLESSGFPYFHTSFEERAINSAADASGYDTLMYNWSKDYCVKYANTNYFPAGFFVSLDVVEEYNTKLKEITEYVKEMSTKFMIGEKDIDAEWQTYLSTLKDLGLDFVISQAQLGYDNYYGK